MMEGVNSTFVNATIFSQFNYNMKRKNLRGRERIVRAEKERKKELEGEERMRGKEIMGERGGEKKQRLREKNREREKWRE
jgi:hypothetical protein